jgi:hypothetical protein
MDFHCPLAGKSTLPIFKFKTNLRFTPTSYVVSDKTIPNYDNSDWAVLSSRRKSHLLANFSFLSTELDRFLQTDFTPINVNTNNKPTVLVISIGSWDVANRNISLFVQYGLPALQQFFDAVQKHLEANRMRIVMVTIPTVNERFNMTRNTLRPHDRTMTCVTTLL